MVVIQLAAYSALLRQKPLFFFICILLLWPPPIGVPWELRALPLAILDLPGTSSYPRMLPRCSPPSSPAPLAGQLADAFLIGLRVWFDIAESHDMCYNCGFDASAIIRLYHTSLLSPFRRRRFYKKANISRRHLSASFQRYRWWMSPFLCSSMKDDQGVLTKASYSDDAVC